MKVIITGTTGMVGEGVLLECLDNASVTEILMVNRKHFELQHPKLKELIVNDFTQLSEYKNQLQGYDACFYCAGVSSIGMNEEQYTKIVYTTTTTFARVLAELNPQMVFNFVTGAMTDTSENGKMMWARVKGKTENDLMQLPFRGQYNFRPGFIEPTKGQKNVKTIFYIFALFYPKLFPSKSLTLTQIGRAMIHSVSRGYTKQVLEIDDIKKLSVE